MQLHQDGGLGVVEHQVVPGAERRPGSTGVGRVGGPVAQAGEDSFGRRKVLEPDQDIEVAELPGRQIAVELLGPEWSFERYYRDLRSGQTPADADQLRRIAKAAGRVGHIERRQPLGHIGG
jgi:hypothetical protein